eukprot:SAG31_NODE_1638_length_7672_cov_4.225142_5_plen_188_part_00
MVRLGAFGAPAFLLARWDTERSMLGLAVLAHYAVDLDRSGVDLTTWTTPARLDGSSAQLVRQPEGRVALAAVLARLVVEGDTLAVVPRAGHAPAPHALFAQPEIGILDLAVFALLLGDQINSFRMGGVGAFHAPPLHSVPFQAPGSLLVLAIFARAEADGDGSLRCPEIKTGTPELLEIIGELVSQI